jgi:hypothetical protein
MRSISSGKNSGFLRGEKFLRGEFLQQKKFRKLNSESKHSHDTTWVDLSSPSPLVMNEVPECHSPTAVFTHFPQFLFIHFIPPPFESFMYNKNEKMPKQNSFWVFCPFGNM